MPEAHGAGVAASVGFTPARYYLELKDWTGAALLAVPDHPASKKNPFGASYLHCHRHGEDGEGRRGEGRG
jgi:hypothetical protein